MDLSTAVADIIDHLELDTEKDAAAVELAKTYAEAIDTGFGDTLEKIGPKLLTVLEALGATPRARAALGKGGPTRVNFTSAIDELRERRATRARRAANLDTAATATDA